jgi:hypothetical protein
MSGFASGGPLDVLAAGPVLAVAVGNITAAGHDPAGRAGADRRPGRVAQADVARGGRAGRGTDL